MGTVVVVVLAVKMPVLAHNEPFGTSPAFEHTQAVQVATDTTEATTEPSTGLVLAVAAPQVPV